MSNFVYTQKEQSIVIELYPKMLIKNIAETIGRNENSVLHLIRRLKKRGIITKAKRGYKPPWTDDEVGYLSDHWGLKPTKAIARKLGRTISGVEVKAHRLRLRKIDSFYTYSALSRELGKSRPLLAEYHHKGWLIGEKASWVCNFGIKPMMFTEENIVKFLQSHYKLFKINKINKIENIYFKNIVKECYE